MGYFPNFLCVLASPDRYLFGGQELIGGALLASVSVRFFWIKKTIFLASWLYLQFSIHWPDRKSQIWPVLLLWPRPITGKLERPPGGQKYGKEGGNLNEL